ncbi:MAG: hypothetical protein WKG07_06745 [Hymenobacter sp.]
MRWLPVIVGWVLPLVIEKLIAAGKKSGVFDKLKANATVSESMERLGELQYDKN